MPSDSPQTPVQPEPRDAERPEPGDERRVQEPAPRDAEPQQARVRTAPRIMPFVGLGAVLGILVALFSAMLGPGSEDYSRGAAFGYFAMLFGMIGAGVGALAALILDRISLKRSESVRLRPVEEAEESREPAGRAAEPRTDGPRADDSAPSAP
ncbi:MFS transporter [Arthrobacter sp. UM1]|uniref:MFS transporter n=1 Tax=Arthrobacter sp. UM1 TaxID=2766776 RepID=UPI001CF62467|nr:MFS transporter [Arthrobacter sp. UM1]MCB4209021.1 MFS transporter [Arthrobacter sp. UM1]